MHAAHSWSRRLFTLRALPERVRVPDQEADADRQTALTIAISDDVLSAWRSVSAVLSAVAAHDRQWFSLLCSDKPKTVE